MKNTIISIIVVVLLGSGIYYFINKSNNVAIINEPDLSTNILPVATTTTPVNKTETVIGKSVEGRNITAYHYGTGDSEILFVGGIHGGYAWNTVLLAYQAMDYFKANPNVVPSNLKVSIIPVLNPDGLNKTVGTSTRFVKADVPSLLNDTVSGRFNANTVDLNRNFDCDWQSNGSWQSRTVSGGSSAFSEPETLALKKYIEVNDPKAVVAWYSAAGGVYSSNCHNGVLPETSKLTSAYAKASGYSANDNFDFYETTGDLTNWLAKINIPAITVLLTNHTDTEWTKNRAGIEAVLKFYTE